MSSHVFAIQLQDLARAALVHRGLSEWGDDARPARRVRRTHAELYAALRDGTLLSIGDINAGFTRAKDVAHIVIAYHEAAVAIDFLVRRFGFPRSSRRCACSAPVRRTAEVLTRITGLGLPELVVLSAPTSPKRLAPYRGTFFVRPRTTRHRGSGSQHRKARSGR